MVICFLRDILFVDSLPCIYMNGNYIERVSQAKFFGVTLSSNLSLNAYVDDIISKAKNSVHDVSIETCWYQPKRFD